MSQEAFIRYLGSSELIKHLPARPHGPNVNFSVFDVECDARFLSKSAILSALTNSCNRHQPLRCCIDLINNRYAFRELDGDYLSQGILKMSEDVDVITRADLCPRLEAMYETIRIEQQANGVMLWKLFRLRYHDQDDITSIVIFCHHSICDGVSIAKLIDDFIIDIDEERKCERSLSFTPASESLALDETYEFPAEALPPGWYRNAQRSSPNGIVLHMKIFGDDITQRCLSFCRANKLSFSAFHAVIICEAWRTVSEKTISEMKFIFAISGRNALNVTDDTMGCFYVCDYYLVPVEGRDTVSIATDLTRRLRASQSTTHIRELSRGRAARTLCASRISKTPVAPVDAGNSAIFTSNLCGEVFHSSERVRVRNHIRSSCGTPELQLYINGVNGRLMWILTLQEAIHSRSVKTKMADYVIQRIFTLC